MNKRSNQKGFTLAELMIAVSILIILVGMLAVIFRATQESFTQASAMQKVFDTSRNVIGRMHDELSAAFFGPIGRTGLYGVDSGDPKLKTGSVGDEVFFYVPLAELESADICEIGYWLRDDGNLMRHYHSESDYDFATAEADDELGLVVEDLNFEYYDGTDYLPSWDSRIGGSQEGIQPKAIRISFLIHDEKDLLEKTFETVVHISSGIRY